jgi:hypothetical protein
MFVAGLKRTNKGNSRDNYLFLLIIILIYFFIYLFIHFISLYVSSIKCSSLGDRIVLIHHLVWLIYVSECLVCRSGGSFLTGIPSSHLHRLIITDDILIQFDLLMMSTVMLETCKEVKWINKYMKKCIRLQKWKPPRYRATRKYCLCGVSIGHADRDAAFGQG